jgi:hypothetical protein
VLDQGCPWMRRAGWDPDGLRGMHMVDCRTIVLAVVAVVAIGVAGCGSSNSSGPSSYVATVNGICSSVDASVAALPATDREGVSGARTELALFESALTKIRRQTPPGSLKSRADVWFATVSSEAALAGRIVALAAAGQLSRARALFPQGNALDSKAASEASAIGLTKCARGSLGMPTMASTSAHNSPANAQISQEIKQSQKQLQRLTKQAGIPTREVSRFSSCLAAAGPGLDAEKACLPRVIPGFRKVESIEPCVLAAGTDITKVEACDAKYLAKYK